jgi:hypothetical protein
MTVKRVLCPQRLRRVPPQFSWVDHRLVRDGHIGRCSARALALYLFLVTVSDAEGLSYYADKTISRLLSMDLTVLSRARQELIGASLIAYQRPLYQVLSLDEVPGDPKRPSQSQPGSLGQILRQAMDQAK